METALLPTIPTANPNDIYPDSGVENLFHYALNLPLTANTRLDNTAPPPTVLNRFGTTFVDTDDDGVAEEYQRLSFPIVRGATDLIYRVQAASSLGGPWENLIVIQPPFLDNRGTFFAGYNGAQSLTNPVAGSGSLITETSGVGGGYRPVVSVVDMNYTAIVTVRDYLPVTSPGSRFMRLVIEEVP